MSKFFPKETEILETDLNDKLSHLKL